MIIHAVSDVVLISNAQPRKQKVIKNKIKNIFLLTEWDMNLALSD